MTTNDVGWWPTSDPTGRSVTEFRILRTGTERPVTGALWSPSALTPLAEGRGVLEGGVPTPATARGVPEGGVLTPLAEKAPAGSVPPPEAARGVPEGGVPTPLAEKAPLVLFGHGASGDRYQQPICHLAHRLVDTVGCHALAIDGPVHGMRQVAGGDRAAFAEEAQRPGFTDDMVADWQAAITAVSERVAVGELAYFGLSMGSLLGIPLLAALSATSQAPKVAVLGLVGSTGAGTHFADRLLADAAKITCPLLFLMQLEDELFPRDGCLAAFDALASADKCIHANPGLHPQVPGAEVEASLAFIRDRLTA